MRIRKGMGIGQGKGYYNIVPLDSHIHSLSAMGVKSKIMIDPKTRGSKSPYYKTIIKNIQKYKYVKDRRTGKSYPRIKFGEEDIVEKGYWDKFPKYCPDCGVAQGYYHHPSCDIEQSPIPDEKGLQLLSSDIAGDFSIEAKGKSPLQAETLEQLDRIADEMFGKPFKKLTKVQKDAVDSAFKDTQFRLNAKMFTMFGSKWKVVEKGKETVLLMNRKGETLRITREEYEAYKPQTRPTGEVIEEVINATGSEKKWDFLGDYEAEITDYKYWQNVYKPPLGEIVYQVKENGFVFWTTDKQKGKVLQKKKLTKKLWNSLKMSDTDREFILKEFYDLDAKGLTTKQKVEKFMKFEREWNKYKELQKEAEIYAEEVSEIKNESYVKEGSGFSQVLEEDYYEAEDRLKQTEKKADKQFDKIVSMLKAKGFRKPKGSIKLEVQQAVTVPSTEFDKQISKKDFNKRVDDVQKWLSKTYGGETSVMGQGGYVSDEGMLIEEPVVVVTAFADGTTFTNKIDDMLGQLNKWKKDWKQESVAYQVEDDLFLI